MALATPTILSNAESNPPYEVSKGGATWPLRAAAVLTTSYVASDHMPCPSAPCVGLWVAYSSAIDYTSIQTIPQGSYDGTNWFDLAAADSQTIANLFATAGTAGGFVVRAQVSQGVRFIRAAIKRTGGTAAGTVSVVGLTGCVA